MQGRVLLLCLFLEVRADDNLATFLAKHKVAMQTYMMTGYGNEWKVRLTNYLNCDL